MRQPTWNCSRWAAVTTIMLALLQMFVFLVLQSVDRMAVRLVVAAGIVLAVASLFAADAVRLASLGNLPNAHLVVERPFACRIAKRLDLRDRTRSPRPASILREALTYAPRFIT
jgi:hypothetical protein